MRVNYKGMDAEFSHRIAEISYDDVKEQRLMDRLETVMLIKGWNIEQITPGYAEIEIDDMNEYRSFVEDYKEVKKSIKMWEKFGF